jgi:hypothetical protein
MSGNGTHGGQGKHMARIRSILPLLVVAGVLATGAASFLVRAQAATGATRPCAPGKESSPECNKALGEVVQKAVIGLLEAENARKVDAYRLAMAASLARRDTADALLAASAYARMVENRDGVGAKQVAVPAELASQALLARALERAPDDAKILAAATWGNCVDAAAACPGDAARARLQQLEPDNALGWLLEFIREDARGHKAQARAALARAARAPTFRDYVDPVFASMLREALADPTVITLTPAELLDGRKQGIAPAQAQRLAKFIDSTDAYGEYTPVGAALRDACDPSAAARDDAALRADCRALLERMDASGSGIGTRMRVRFLLARLATGPDDKARLQARRREINWLFEVGHWFDHVDGGGYGAAMDTDIADILAGVDQFERLQHYAAARGLAMPPDYRDRVDKREGGK